MILLVIPCLGHVSECRLLLGLELIIVALMVLIGAELQK
jgi:hypothetical protein